MVGGDSGTQGRGVPENGVTRQCGGGMAAWARSGGETGTHRGSVYRCTGVV